MQTTVPGSGEDWDRGPDGSPRRVRKPFRHAARGGGHDDPDRTRRKRLREDARRQAEQQLADEPAQVVLHWTVSQGYRYRETQLDPQGVVSRVRASS